MSQQTSFIIILFINHFEAGPEFTETKKRFYEKLLMMKRDLCLMLRPVIIETVWIHMD